MSRKFNVIWIGTSNKYYTLNYSREVQCKTACGRLIYWSHSKSPLAFRHASDWVIKCWIPFSKNFEGCCWKNSRTACFAWASDCLECLLQWPKDVEVAGGQIQTVRRMLQYLPMQVLHLDGVRCARTCATGPSGKFKNNTIEITSRETPHIIRVIKSRRNDRRGQVSRFLLGTGGIPASKSATRAAILTSFSLFSSVRREKYPDCA
jgi:hypothetical protein